MKTERAVIVFALLFSVAFGLYLGVSRQTPPPEPGPQAVVETPRGPESGKKAPAEADPETRKPAPVEQPALDAFDETALEGEFEDVQAGIDLLNDPFR